MKINKNIEIKKTTINVSVFADENTSITLQPLREKQKVHVTNVTNKLSCYSYKRKRQYHVWRFSLSRNRMQQINSITFDILVLVKPLWYLQISHEHCVFLCSGIFPVDSMALSKNRKLIELDFETSRSIIVKGFLIWYRYFLRKGDLAFPINWKTFS